MYKDELKKQIKILRLSQRIYGINVTEAISLSREILRLAHELERIETEEKSDIDKIAENVADTMYELISKGKATVI